MPGIFSVGLTPAGSLICVRWPPVPSARSDRSEREPRR